MKLQDLMSHTLSHTFHSKSQPYNYLTKSIALICTKQHYICQALYMQKTVHMHVKCLATQQFYYKALLLLCPVGVFSEVN